MFLSCLRGLSLASKAFSGLFRASGGPLRGFLAIWRAVQALGLHLLTVLKRFAEPEPFVVALFSRFQVLPPNHTLQRTGTAARCAAVCRPLSSCSLGAGIHRSGPSSVPSL